MGLPYLTLITLPNIVIVRLVHNGDTEERSISTQDERQSSNH